MVGTVSQTRTRCININDSVSGCENHAVRVFPFWTGPIDRFVRPELQSRLFPPRPSRQLPFYPDPTLLTLSRRSRPHNMVASGLPVGPQPLVLVDARAH